MTRFCICCAFFVVAWISASAQNSLVKKKLNATLSAGVVEENLTWSIAGNLSGKNPNIYSELIWKDVRGGQVSLDITYNFWKAFVIHADIASAFIFAGSATDSDYEQDNRTSRVFFATPRSDKGNLFSLHPSIGYQIAISKKLILTPEAGYGLSTQKLFLLDDAGLNSTYQTLWKGFFWSARSDLYVNEKFGCHLGATYHQVNYHAEADWNLIETFRHPVSFEHTAKGYGITADLAFAYQLTKSWALVVSGEIFKWTTGIGIDTLYLNDGADARTRLNDVTRNGYGIKLGMSYSIPIHEPHIGLQ
jgi:hypothetical protein